MIRLRPSTAADVAANFAIWRGAVLATHHFLTPEDFATIEALVRDDYLPAAAFTVAVDADDRPLGFMGMTDAHIDALFVAPEAHGQGVGSALMAYARGLHPVLTVDVNEQNGGAVGFYHHRGFEAFGRSPTDDAGRPYPLLHLRG